MIRFHSKDLMAIAKILKSVKPNEFLMLEDRQWRKTVEEFAAAFTINNPLFDEGRFFKACGYVKGD